jgi:hypothetical protein
LNGTPKRIGKRKVGNRPPGGCVGDSPTAGASKRIGKTNPSYVLGVLVLPMRFPPHCFRLASLAENTTAWRSVAHLTITNPFWRLVPTCSVPLRTEAGGTPAFQSAPLRGNCRLRRRVTVEISTRFPHHFVKGKQRGSRTNLIYKLIFPNKTTLVAM